MSCWQKMAVFGRFVAGRVSKIFLPAQETWHLFDTSLDPPAVVFRAVSILPPIHRLPELLMLQSAAPFGSDSGAGCSLPCLPDMAGIGSSWQVNQRA